MGITVDIIAKEDKEIGTMLQHHIIDGLRFVLVCTRAKGDPRHQLSFVYAGVTTRQRRRDERKKPYIFHHLEIGKGKTR